MDESATKIAAVIGDPISHSMSPMLHNAWLKQLGIDGEYVAMHVAADQLEDALESFIEQQLAGFNVTLPHKEKLLGLVDEVEDTAEAIGAVNTVVIQGEKLLGFNTDAYGFWQNLKPQITDKEATLKHPVVLGAGGAARAVVYALEKAGAKEIHVLARDVQKASNIKEVSKNIALDEFSHFRSHQKHASLIINTTPLGMKGVNAFDWDLSDLSNHALVTDIVYNPIETPLLAAARARGNPVVDGLGMLIHQALPGFEAWFGARPNMDEAAFNQLKKQLIDQCNLSQ